MAQIEAKHNVVVLNHVVDSASLLEVINSSARASDYLLRLAHEHRGMSIPMPVGELIAREVKALSLLKKMVDPPTIRMIRED